MCASRRRDTHHESARSVCDDAGHFESDKKSLVIGIVEAYSSRPSQPSGAKNKVISMFPISLQHPSHHASRLECRGSAAFGLQGLLIGNLPAGKASDAMDIARLTLDRLT